MVPLFDFFKPFFLFGGKDGVDLLVGLPEDRNHLRGVLTPQNIQLAVGVVQNRVQLRLLGVVQQQLAGQAALDEQLDALRARNGQLHLPPHQRARADHAHGRAGNKHQRQQQ